MKCIDFVTCDPFVHGTVTDVILAYIPPSSQTKLRDKLFIIVQPLGLDTKVDTETRVPQQFLWYKFLSTSNRTAAIQERERHGSS